MNADDLSRRIVVRHREAGYLRLELPPAICHAAALAAIEAALRRVAGVYRVTRYPVQRRLAVSFDARLCATADVACALKACLPGLPAAPDAATAAAAAPEATHDRPGAAAAARRAAQRARQAFAGLRRQIDALRHAPAAPGSVHAKLQPVVANALTEKAVINFLNDVVAFYLVKVHWELISQRWLKYPAKHADAWLAVFYLMFLLVRYRKSIAAPAQAGGAS